MKKIYIAGKVTGLDKDDVTAKFGAMQKEVEANGFEAVNPIEVVGDWNTPWNEAMKMCIKALLDCDTILLIYDYENSKGALIEKQVAEAMGMKVIYDYEINHF